MRKMVAATLVAVFVTVMLTVQPLPAQPPDREGAASPARYEADSPAGDGAASPAGAMITFYRQWLSSADGDRCPMYPTCSRYSQEAFQEHGLLKGWIMTCDRLLRCGRDELSLAPRIVIDGRTRCYDPLEINAYWPEK
ncbi:MAG: membrane protein insertion efficiency factor YidD [Desulfosudaceae bacterium]